MNQDGDGRTAEIGVVLAFFALSGVVVWQCLTDLAAAGAASGSPQENAAFVPLLLAGLMVALGLIQLVRIWLGRGAVSTDVETDGPTGEAAEAPPPEGRLLLRAVLTVVWLGLFIVVMPIIGFYLALPLLLALTLVTLDVRNVFVVVGLSIGGTLVTAYAFGALLNVVLPAGVFEISIW
jgi:hypothetical protein